MPSATTSDDPVRSGRTESLFDHDRAQIVGQPIDMPVPQPLCQIASIDQTGSQVPAVGGSEASSAVAKLRGQSGIFAKLLDQARV
jgi:hypothetical protein